jgi:hypothetical protein
VCQSRGVAGDYAPACQMSQSALPARQRGGAGSRQPQPTQPRAQKPRAPASSPWRAAAMPPSTNITCTNSLSRPEGFSLSRETLRGILRAARSGTIGAKAGPRLTAQA